MFDAITNVIEGKLAGPLEKLSNQRHLRAIRDGIIATLPIIIVSSLLMVVAFFTTRCLQTGRSQNSLKRMQSQFYYHIECQCIS